MKRTGFKELTYEEKLAKAKKAQARARERAKAKSKKKKKARKVKYPTYLGIKAYRYTGLKGCLWTIFSRYTRKRDFIKYKGRCVSCPSVLTDWTDGDAGHYVSVSRGNFETLFDERNVHLQCKKCNNPKWTPDASIPFAYEVDRRLGKGTADDIYRRSQGIGKAYSELEYQREIARYKELFEAL